MDYKELAQVARVLITLARGYKIRGAIVALSCDKDGHSEFVIDMIGPCLELEGLSKRIECATTGLWTNKLVNNVPVEPVEPIIQKPWFKIFH